MMEDARLPSFDPSACPEDFAGENFPPGLTIPPDPSLLAEGWVQRFMTDPARARESMELYASLGFEVRAEAINPQRFGSVCQDCQLLACRSYVVIYTRRKG